MKTVKFEQVFIILTCLLSLFISTGSARTHFHVSFGAGLVQDCSGFYSVCWPHYRWQDGYYRWLDRDRYIWLDIGRYRHPEFCRPRHFYWRSPWRGSAAGIWRQDCCSIVSAAPVIVEVPQIITKREIIVRPRKYGYKPRYDVATAKLFEKLRHRKNELLKTLKIASKEGRLQAIRDLAGFCFDDRVRKALEEVLSSEPNPELRKEVIKSFSKVKNKKVLAALEKAKVEDADQEVRRQAAIAIKKLKGDRDL